MQKTGMLIFFIISTVIGFLDGSIIGTTLLSLLVVLVGNLCSNKISIQNRGYSNSILYIVATIYLVSAYITSFAYHIQNHEIFRDCFGYTKDIAIKSLDFDINFWLIAGYKNFEDLNVLHELGYRLFIIFSNNHLDGATVFTLTYVHSFFGILSSVLLFRLLLIYIPPYKAMKHTLAFAFLSPFYIYSIVVMRDIIIACLYLFAFNIILRDFKLKGVFYLFLILILALGCRLYSGIFVLSFIFYYLYKRLESSKYSKILVGFFVLFTVIFVVKYVLNSDIFNQSSEELTTYIEYDSARATGFSSKLTSLPIGLKEIALTIYSQVHPFPFYDLVKLSNSFSTLFITIVKSTSVLWWYYIFFGLCYSLFINKRILKYGFSSLLLLCIIASFIIFNSIQIDVRRIMSIYPLIYVFYIHNYEVIGTQVEKARCNKKLSAIYFSLLMIYIIFIQR